jgi:hypothetical protein
MVGGAAAEIRDLRLGVGLRIDKEHTTLAAISAGGEHKAGSAKAYEGGTDPAEEPTEQPDETTALTDADAGRLWIDDSGVMHYYDGTGWELVSVSVGGTGVVNATNLVDELDLTGKLLAGSLVAADLAASLDLSAKTLVLPEGQVLNLPTVSDFTNATHDHGGVDNSGGGLLHSMYPRAQSGTYGGNGGATFVVNLLFDPTVVILARTTGTKACWLKLPNMTGGYAMNLASAAYADIALLVTLGAGGGEKKFTVHHTGSAADTNVLNATYMWVALG